MVEMERKKDSIKMSTCFILSAATLSSTSTPVMLQTDLPKNPQITQIAQNHTLF